MGLGVPLRSETIPCVIVSLTEVKQMSHASCQRDCMFEGDKYSHGSEVCTATKCLRCEDGTWSPSMTTDRERVFVDWL